MIAKREKKVSNVIQKLFFTSTPLFSFALCEQNDPNKPPTKDCFMKHQLTVNNEGSILVLSPWLREIYRQIGRHKGRQLVKYKTKQIDTYIVVYLNFKQYKYFLKIVRLLVSQIVKQLDSQTVRQLYIQLDSQIVRQLDSQTVRYLDIQRVILLDNQIFRESYSQIVIKL